MLLDTEKCIIRLWKKNAELNSINAELLEACKAAMDSYHDLMEYNKAMQIVEQAIARAEGGDDED